MPSGNSAGSVKPPQTQVLDGISLAPAFPEQPHFRARDCSGIFPVTSATAASSSAIREGDFKLIEFFEDGGKREFYNLRTDPNEEHDLSTELPEQAAALYRTLQTWQSETGVALPRGANRNYDPAAERPRGGQTNNGNERRGKVRKNAPNSGT